MKRLFFVLSFACLYTPIFCAQEAQLPSQLQEQDITPEHFESSLQGAVAKFESESCVKFFGILERHTIQASRDKATDTIQVDDVIKIPTYHTWIENGEMILMRDGWSNELQPSRYNKFALITYNALQALYEKQQEEGKKNL